jgi:AcrR family transcriptional regulator
MNKETRQRLIQDSFEADLREVALELFAKHGFDAVSSSDIAFAAGISERLLHLHFSGTEDILLRGFCESGPEFCKALMAMPRTLLPVDALQLAMASQTAPSISLERVHAIMILCEDSPRLRGLAVERCQSWQEPETGFGADFWASAVFDAFKSALQVEAGTAAIHAEFNQPAKVIERAFENLRAATAPAQWMPAGLNDAQATSSPYRPRKQQSPAIQMAGDW